MNSARTTARKALPMVCLVLFGLPGSGCGDDDDSSGGAGNAGRAGGAGGHVSSNSGGAKSTGGGELSGGAGGFDGGVGGELSGGAGGVAATGGSGGAGAQLRQCAESCSVDSDCFMDPGTPDDFVCSPTTHRCVYHACDGDQDCGLLGNVWTTKCADDSTCAASETCVDVKGSGHCANMADSGPCPTDRESVGWKHFGGGPDVQVCADTSFHCVANACVRPCTTASCRNGTACNTVSGQCDLCATDLGCTLLNRPPHCNTATQQCECHTSADCPSDRNTDICVNGSCGCSDTSACTRKNGQNAALVCE